MADWDKDWRKKKERDEEKEREWEQAKKAKKGVPAPGSTGGGLGGGTRPKTDDIDPATAKVDELIDRAGPMIEQLNNLYNMYFAGAEKRPPIERRKQLDQIMDVLTKMPKVTATQKFKYQGVQSQYIAYRDKWEKRLSKM